MICEISPTGLQPIWWIQSIFHECAYTLSQEISVVFGYLSITSWLFAQVPQLVKNWMLKSSESISILFLFNWLSGDFANLIGCLLTDQLPFQTYLAAYFVLIDSSLFLQSLYYRTPAVVSVIESAVTIDEFEQVAASEDTPFLQQDGGEEELNISFWARFLLLFGAVSASASTNQSSLSDSLAIGRISAWICTILYFSSRIPQIVKNYNRQSTDGLAILMFVCALLGNVFYTISIISRSMESEYLINALPYLIGSGGTVIFDLTIFAQYLYYPRVS